MRSSLLGASLTLTFSTGCVCGDFGFTYHVKGRLVDAGTQRPLVQYRLAVDEEADLAPATVDPYWPKTTITGNDGSFDTTFSTGMWGYTKFLGIPITDPTPPVPREVAEVTVYLQNAGGAWTRKRVNIAPGQQTRTAGGERWIDIGTVEIDAKHATTDPAADKGAKTMLMRHAHLTMDAPEILLQTGVWVRLISTDTSRRLVRLQFSSRSSFLVCPEGKPCEDAPGVFVERLSADAADVTFRWWQ